MTDQDKEVVWGFKKNQLMQFIKELASEIDALQSVSIFNDGIYDHELDPLSTSLINALQKIETK